MTQPFEPTPTTLTGAFVRLEPIALHHAEGIFQAGKFDAIWTFMPHLPLADVGGARAYIEQAFADQAAGHSVVFTTIDARTERVVGSTRYLDIRKPHRGLEIGGTWITPDAQRSAINTEAKRLMLAHAFETLGAIRVALKTHHENVRSQRAIERIGGVREGVLRSHMIMPNGSLRDTVYYSLVEREWPAARTRLDARLAR